MKTLLSLKNVDVFYGRIHAVRRATLHVRQGEIVDINLTVSAINRSVEEEEIVSVPMPKKSATKKRSD